MTFYNINIGILGHVDAGKTLLAKKLSTTSSTASFDKSRQSQKRKITLDLGFSQRFIPIPPQMEEICQELGFEKIQLTFVDCPGHSSLIKTIVGGSQIIDYVLMVIDANKGIQTQTSEGFILSELSTKNLLIVINKTDTIPSEKYEKRMINLKKHIRRALKPTSFHNSPIVEVSAFKDQGIDTLLEQLSATIQFPPRINLLLNKKLKESQVKPFFMNVDHCFLLRGKGTILTGTILSGIVKVGDMIEIPSKNVTKQVKSMQVFRKDVKTAREGDRVGIRIVKFDASTFERGVVCAPNSVPTFTSAIINIQKIPYFKLPIASKKIKFTVMVGHISSMASLILFQEKAINTNVKEKEKEKEKENEKGNEKENEKEKEKEKEFEDEKKKEKFDFLKEYEYVQSIEGKKKILNTYALLEFAKPITCPLGSLLIGGRFDLPSKPPMCRLSFHGKIIHTFENLNENLSSVIKIYKTKTKKGKITRIAGKRVVIVSELFNKNSDIGRYTSKVLLIGNDRNIKGVILRAFGKTGKIKVQIDSGTDNIQIGTPVFLLIKKFID